MKTTSHFDLTIRLGNSAMQSAEDIARALRTAADRIMISGAHSGHIHDINGNTVGGFDISKS